MLKLFALLVVVVAVQASNSYGQYQKVDYPPMATLIYPPYGVLPGNCPLSLSFSYENVNV